MITKKEVQHVAKLARLNLSKIEIEKYQKELLKILDYIGKLKKINTSINEKNYFHFNIMKEDKVLKFNKKLIDGYLKVKSILKT